MDKPLGWIVRERRDSDGELQDCFVEAPREGRMAYGLEVLGDDYQGYGGVERKLEHCRMIVKWANAAQYPTSAPDSSDADLLRKYIRLVVHCEGIDFLSLGYAREFFTPAELERLNALSDEAGQQEET